ncbi:hypothetical protein ROM48_06570 [Cronobacter malonaticus]|uniref:tail fiber/spike domain-containing protein n=1 Tax=Cronobacter malonaticus TaxID=413503 RepID=UPI00289556BB|nr:hypothetical protein [Cronobacter malonaticus]MDT3535683.1 hypothetical protein [Cronobacter malonaticus]
MATQPTNLPVPSESPRDLKFNAGKIDEFVTSLVTTYIDRFGNEHYTIEGLNQLARQAIAAFGWIPVGTFQAGATISLPNQILKDTSSGEYYRWDGALPKVVPSGSTPASTGGTGVGAWISVGDSALRSMLAATTGAGLVGYSASVTYPTGTVGEALGPYKATGGTRKISREDRAALMGRNIADFSEYDTDAGAAVNAAISVVKAATDPSVADMHGDTIHIPQGVNKSSSSILLGEAYPTPGLGITIEGNGVTSSYIDLNGAPAGTNGIEATSGGALYPHLLNFAVNKAPVSAFRLNKATRGIFESLQSVYSNSDGFYFGNVFMCHMRQLHAVAGNSHGINFAYGTTDGPTTDVYTKTSIAAHTMYARNNSGVGIAWGDTYYSHSFANGSDGNGQSGYRYRGRIRSVASTSDGSESNQGPGVAVIPDGSRESIKTLSFRNLYGYGNNRANNGSPNLLLVQPSNGAEAWVSLEAGTSVPAGAGSSTKDVLVIGSGAHLYLKGDCDLPNGFESRSGGYIHFEQVPIVTNKTIPLSTGTAICSLQSTQGKTLRYAGKLNIVVRNNHPSSDGSANISIYELLIQKSDSGSNAVKVISQGGYADQTPGAGAVSWPVFAWSLNSSTNNLVATPAANVGGVEFWFEIVASGQIVASTI